MNYHHFNIDLACEVGITKAILLENIAFWIQKNQANNKHFYNERYWTYNSAKAFGEIFPYMNIRKIERELRELEEEGYLLSGNFNTSPYDRTKWYALNNKSEKFFKKICLKNNLSIDTQKFEYQKAKYGEPIPDNKPYNKHIKEKNNIKKEKDNFEVVEVNEDINDYQIIKANENKDLALKANNDILEQEFDLFYSLYPRKIAKITAKNAFKQLRAGKHKNCKGITISLENILLKLSDLINEITLNGTDPKFIPYPASWLNANDFLDNKDNESVTSPRNNQNCINEIKELFKNLAVTTNDEFKKNPAFKESKEYPAFKKQLLFTCLFKIKEICNKHKCSYYKYYGFHEIELPQHELKYKWYLTKSFGDWLKEALNSNNNSIENNTKQIKS